jgi:hypothetical protein
MSRLKSFLTFSNAVAVIALFFALGGTVYAASGKISGTQIKPKSIPGNRLKAKAITSAQIKPGAVGAAQIKSGAVSAKQIKSGSISAAQVKSGSLTATQINQGSLTGISAANIHSVQYVTTTIALPAKSAAGTNGTATCPVGMKVIGGGAGTTNTTYGSIFESSPTTDRNGWIANGYSGIAGVNMTVTAICTAVAVPTG